MAEIKGRKVNLFYQVCDWINKYGDEIFVSVRIKKQHDIFWDSLLIDDIETLIIDDFKADNVHVQPDIFFGDGFPLSSEAMWKVSIAATAND